MLHAAFAFACRRLDAQIEKRQFDAMYKVSTVNHSRLLLLAYSPLTGTYLHVVRMQTDEKRRARENKAAADLTKERDTIGAALQATKMKAGLVTT